MDVSDVEADLRWKTGASGDKSRCGGRKGRVSGPDKEDDGADEARGCDARLLVVAVDEKRPSLAVDDAVLVGAPAWWRTVAMDVVEDDDDGWGGGRRLVWGWGVLARMGYEWEMEGEVRGTMFLGCACLKYGKVTNLAPI